jgi:adenylate cyclase
LKRGVEIERKFLVREEALPPLPPGEEIEQAYLGLEPSVRVRVRAARGTLTVKGPGLRRRREVEVEVGVRTARELLELRVEGTVVVRKRRHEVRWGGRTWEIDRFESPFEGLVVAEVELDSQEERVELPPWVREEVTDDPAYQNVNLARAGKRP